MKILKIPKLFKLLRKILTPERIKILNRLDIIQYKIMTGKYSSANIEIINLKKLIIEMKGK